MRRFESLMEVMRAALSRRLPGFMIGVVSGAAIWLLSRPLTGHAEPWDGPAGYYPGALFLAGLLCALAYPGRPGAVAFGILVGQVLVFTGRVATNPAGGGLWPLGLLFLGVYVLVALLGAAAGTAIRLIF